MCRIKAMYLSYHRFKRLYYWRQWIYNKHSCFYFYFVSKYHHIYQILISIHTFEVSVLLYIWRKLYIQSKGIFDKQQNRLYISRWKQPTAYFSMSKKQVPRLVAVGKRLLKNMETNFFFAINVKFNQFNLINVNFFKK